MICLLWFVNSELCHVSVMRLRRQRNEQKLEKAVLCVGGIKKYNGILPCQKSIEFNQHTRLSF